MSSAHASPDPRAELDRWVTFDCYGTLIDWHAGFGQLLKPIAGPQTEALKHAYHRHERILQAQRPHRSYKQVLAASLRRATEELGIRLEPHAEQALVAGWHSMAAFPDVEPMLAGLRSLGCRLAVLTNCDDDLFAQTQRAFARPFDLVITAERVGQYKPHPAHFQQFAAATGAPRQTWVHVACSWFHDIAPARELGMQSVWLDRDRTGEDASAASRRVTSAAEVVAAVRALTA
jgi:2-haloacid dehalogenase